MVMLLDGVCCCFCSKVPSVEMKSHRAESQGRQSMMLASFCLITILTAYICIKVTTLK